MKRLKLSAVITLGLLSGCGVLNEVNSGINYINESTEYMNEAQVFAEDLSSLANDAVNNEDAGKKLESRLTEMKSNIEEFNKLTPPEAATSVHEEAVKQNEKLLSGIDQVQTAVKEGTFQLEQLENSEIMGTITEVTDLMKTIEKIQE
ncbi:MULTISPECIES: DUF6376 family protein [Bacillus]|uniref:Lipoprotein n=2 Tax=Bacillus TaxID=1386 RepID=A0A0M4FHG7_9BACI|nr:MULTISPECIES: DUF6376 family protein [Bacillus]ALC82174.1 hypothetical protein AM592_11730 [Bacillus gobiensis]MBP1081007.1 phage shock protein A [Bacillus capparidis]MED1095699.1 DUF6376 family protein [Bacillus capparidis]